MPRRRRQKEPEKSVQRRPTKKTRAETSTNTCFKCGKEFVRPGNLAKHLSGCDPYSGRSSIDMTAKLSCPVTNCGVKCKGVQSIKSHIGRFHADLEIPSMMLSPEDVTPDCRCRCCGRIFSKPVKLARHATQCILSSSSPSSSLKGKNRKTRQKKANSNRATSTRRRKSEERANLPLHSDLLPTKQFNKPQSSIRRALNAIRPFPIGQSASSTSFTYHHRHSSSSRKTKQIQTTTIELATTDDSDDDEKEEEKDKSYLHQSVNEVEVEDDSDDILLTSPFESQPSSPSVVEYQKEQEQPKIPIYGYWISDKSQSTSGDDYRNHANSNSNSTRVHSRSRQDSSDSTSTIVEELTRVSLSPPNSNSDFSETSNLSKINNNNNNNNNNANVKNPSPEVQYVGQKPINPHMFQPTFVYPMPPPPLYYYPYPSYYYWQNGQSSSRR